MSSQQQPIPCLSMHTFWGVDFPICLASKLQDWALCLVCEKKIINDMKWIRRRVQDNHVWVCKSLRFILNLIHNRTVLEHLARSLIPYENMDESWTTAATANDSDLHSPNIKTRRYLYPTLQSNVHCHGFNLNTFCVQHTAQCNEMQRIMKSNECEMANKQTIWNEGEKARDTKTQIKTLSKLVHTTQNTQTLDYIRS